MTKLKAIIKEIDRIKEALKVLNNYDAQIEIVITSFHNDNKKQDIEVRLPSTVCKEVCKKELEEKLELLLSQYAEEVWNETVRLGKIATGAKI